MRTLCFTLVLAAILAVSSPPLLAQNNPDSDNNSAVPGWRGYLSIDYKGGKWIMPYSRIVSLSQHEYDLSTGGHVHELTIDTTGGVTARYYYLSTGLEDAPTNAAAIVNNRIQDLENRVADRVDEPRRVVKTYPATTHSKTVEFNVTQLNHLKIIFDHITDEWIEQEGRGNGRWLTFE